MQSLRTSIVSGVFIALLWGGVARAATIYVDDDAPSGGDGTSWVAPFRFLQDALLVAEAGDEIRVAGGRYQPDQDEAGVVTPGDRAETFQLSSGIALYGGYVGYGAVDPDVRDVVANDTVLSGDLTGNDGPGFVNNDENSHHVVTASNTDATAVLDGFTVPGGNAEYAAEGEQGGGVYADGSSATIVNCTVRGNAAVTVGGGISCESSDLLVNRCVITRNKSFSAGGGISCHGDSQPTISNCIISHNFATYEGGGIYCYDSSPAIVNSAIYRNTTGIGGGISCSRLDDVVLTNCTITQNIADTAGGIHYYSSDLAISNCIIWANAAEELHTWSWSGSGSPYVAYSNIEGGWPGAGNIDVDPSVSFAEDLHLLADSPCIDAGTNAPVGGLPPDDLDGGLRPLDGDGDSSALADMGAYEFNPAAPSIALSTDALEFVAPIGGPSPEEQSLEVRNCGGATLNWEILEACPWLEVAPAAGSSTGEIDVIGVGVNMEDLEHGKHVAVLTVADPEAMNSPRTVRVVLQVYATLYVPSEYATIQEAIDATIADYDTVLVADGLYTGPGNRDLDFGGRAITVRSEHGPQDCIIDCEGEGRGFSFDSGEGAAAVVEGFTITGGLADEAGGVYCYESSPTLIDCIFEGNAANHDGGAVYGWDSDVTLRDCVFSGNAADSGGGGGAQFAGGHPRCINCVFSDNTAHQGGGLHSNVSSPTLVNCTFHNNVAERYGGGMFHKDPIPPPGKSPVAPGEEEEVSSELETRGGWYPASLTNCRFIGNHAQNEGGGVYTRLAMTLANCIFSGNTAGSGGGVCAACESEWGPYELAMTNCTFSQNAAPAGFGGGVHLEGDVNTVLANCVFWENHDSSGTTEYAQVYRDWFASSVFEYCTVHGWSGVFGGTGNTGDDPLFVDADGPDDAPGTEDDDLALLPGSPCIDAGTNAAIPPDTLDLDGDGDTTEPLPFDAVMNSRFVDDPCVEDAGQQDPSFPELALVDRGAYERPDDSLDDPDEDGIINCYDNCPVHANPDQADCDDDGVGDLCSLAFGLARDCNGNDFPDECDIADGVSADDDLDGVPDECQQVIYVDDSAPPGGDGTSWAAALTDLQEALSVAEAGDEIHVAGGIYKPAGPNGDRLVSFELVSVVELYGGYAGYGAPDPDERDIALYETILSGDLNGDDEPAWFGNDENSRHVVSANGTDVTALLSGFTVTGGNADVYPDCIGAGMHLSCSDVTVAHCTFRENCAVGTYGEGGGMYVGPSGTPRLTACRFIGNSADYRGGGLSSYNTSLELNGCTFSANSGGGMYVFRSSAVLAECGFSGNWTTSGGAGLRIVYGSVVVNNCTFGGNWAEWYGGGICSSASSLVLSDCTFKGNSAKYGGGIECYHDNAVLSDCTFIENSSSRFGGGAYFRGDSDVKFEHCVFWENSAGERGGGLAVTQSAVMLDHCTIANNEAKEAGGGIDCNRDAAALDDCTITGNSAVRGGGICFRSGDSTLVACTIEENSASSGGGVYCESGNPTLTACTIGWNTASSGSGVYCESGDPSLLVCTIGRNTTSYRGCVYCEGGNPTFTACTIGWNTAPAGGGLGCYGGAPLLTSCLITGNEVISKGGGLYCGAGSPRLTNCTVVANTAGSSGGGMYCYGASSPLIVGSILWGNVADSQPNQISGAYADIVYSDIAGGYAGQGNINSDPLFVGPTGPDGVAGTEDDNLRLAAGSPCIDAGNNLAVPLDIVDIDEDCNTVEPSPVDLDGQPRFADDLLTPDTGIETAPIIDMGAYEYADCNGNEIPDQEDIADCGAGDVACADCNANGIPDGCDVSLGLSADDDPVDGGDGVPDECQGHIRILWSDPPDWAIDARQPRATDVGSPVGWDSAALLFNGGVSDWLPEDFTVKEVGGDEVAPVVVGVEHVCGNTGVVQLSEPIEPVTWTIITHTPTGAALHLGYLPADADGSGVANANDIVEEVEGVIHGGPLHRYDTDRDGEIAASDITTLVDLLNGAGTWDPYFSVSLPPVP